MPEDIRGSLRDLCISCVGTLCVARSRVEAEYKNLWTCVKDSCCHFALGGGKPSGGVVLVTWRLGESLVWELGPAANTIRTLSKSILTEGRAALEAWGIHLNLGFVYKRATKKYPYQQFDRVKHHPDKPCPVAQRVQRTSRNRSEAID